MASDRPAETPRARFFLKPATIIVDPSCTRSTIEGNLGAKTVKKPVDFNHGRR